jgi:hypothetical protein
MAPRRWELRTVTRAAPSRSSQMQNMTAPAIAITVGPIGRSGATGAVIGHKAMPNAYSTRHTDNGLMSSSGAPRANHERSLGKSRLRTMAALSRRVLVTAPPGPPEASSHSRQNEVGGALLMHSPSRHHGAPEGF